MFLLKKVMLLVCFWCFSLFGLSFITMTYFPFNSIESLTIKKKKLLLVNKISVCRLRTFSF